MLKNILEKFLLVVPCVFISYVGAAQAPGGGGMSSGGGGGIVIFQAEGLKALLSSNELLWKFKTQDAIKKIEQTSITSEKAHYQILNSRNCVIEADIVAIKDSAAKFKITVSEMKCPEANPGNFDLNDRRECFSDSDCSAFTCCDTETRQCARYACQEAGLIDSELQYSKGNRR